MNKSRTNIYDANRAAAIKWTAEKCNCTKEYVRAIINGTTNGGRSEEILKVYRKKYNELQKVLS